jgi:hypothetical protein
MALLCFLASAAPFSAQAQMLHMMESNPAARSVTQGQAQEFFVRFDGPVDHQALRLMIQRGDVVLRTLRPRLGASANTLYAVAGSLPPGDCVLRWVAAPRAGGVPSQGALDFTIRRTSLSASRAGAHPASHGCNHRDGRAADRRRNGHSRHRRRHRRHSSADAARRRPPAS